MIRQGPWKYSTDPGFDIDQLFNLDDDPNELRNLAGRSEHAGLVNGFRKALLDWRGMMNKRFTKSGEEGTSRI